MTKDYMLTCMIYVHRMCVKLMRVKYMYGSSEAEGVLFINMIYLQFEIVNGFEFSRYPASL